MRALIIATFRHEELAAAQPLTVVLGDLATAPGVRRLTLAPLSRDAVGQLARGTTADVDELYRTTGGNPFFVTEVLGARSRGVPQTVHELARAWPGPPSARPRKREALERPAKQAAGARRRPRRGPSSRRPGDAPEGAPARAPCRAGAPAGKGWGGDRRRPSRPERSPAWRRSSVVLPTPAFPLTSTSEPPPVAAASMPCRSAASCSSRSSTDMQSLNQLMQAKHAVFHG